MEGALDGRSPGDQRIIPKLITLQLSTATNTRTMIENTGSAA
jgi:hypothetical protein